MIKRLEGEREVEELGGKKDRMNRQKNIKYRVYLD